MVAQGGEQRHWLSDEEHSIAGMAEEITHVVESIFCLTEWISRWGGIDFFPTGNGWNRFLGGFKYIILIKSYSEISSARCHEKQTPDRILGGWGFRIHLSRPRDQTFVLLLYTHNYV